MSKKKKKNFNKIFFIFHHFTDFHEWSTFYTYTQYIQYTNPFDHLHTKKPTLSKDYDGVGGGGAMDGGGGTMPGGIIPGLYIPVPDIAEWGPSKIWSRNMYRSLCMLVMK